MIKSLVSATISGTILRSDDGACQCGLATARDPLNNRECENLIGLIQSRPGNGLNAILQGPQKFAALAMEIFSMGGEEYDRVTVR